MGQGIFSIRRSGAFGNMAIGVCLGFIGIGLLVYGIAFAWLER